MCDVVPSAAGTQPGAVPVGVGWHWRLAQAKKQGKSVLLQHSGPQCYPCLLLSRFLKKHAALIAKDYVYVRIDSRYKHGKDVIDRTRKGKERSIPWMVVLDADGKPRITSDGPKGNIGLPSEPEGIAQFRKMLLATRRNLTDGEIRSLLKELSKQP
jgi:Thioredoxin-like